MSTTFSISGLTVSNLRSGSSESLSNPTVGCWGRCQKRIVKLAHIGKGFASGISVYVKNRFFSFIKTTQIVEAVRDNWVVLSEGLKTQKEKLLWTGFELSVFAACYIYDSPLNGPTYLAVLYISLPNFVDHFSKLPPQDDPKVLPWKKIVDSLQKQYTIQKPIQICFSDQFACQGYAKGPIGPIIISVPENETHTPDENLFAIGHELGHAINNDQLIQPLAVAAFQFGGTLLFWLFSSTDSFLIVRSAKYALSMKALSMIVNYIYANYCERRADEVALHFEPKEQMHKGAITLFEKHLETHKKHRTKKEKTLIENIWKKLIITPSGNIMVGIHPFSTSRIRRAKLN